MNKKNILAITALITLLIPAISTATAATYYGPSFSVTPSITPGQPISITMTVGSSSTFTAPPAGSALCNIANPSTCFFPLQACTTFGYYQINQATITDPNGNAYMLGSSVTSGLANPFIGRFTNSPGGPFAPAINGSQTDVLTMPFGAGAGGFTMTSNLPNPPNNVSPEGPYYWWTVAGNVHGSDLRLDQNPTINPTTTSGTYNADLEGAVYCGSSRLFFDASMEFIVTPGIGGPTRTIGWWQTHLAAENATWNAYLASHPGGASICGVTILTAAQAMGGLWASIPKLSDGHTARLAVDHAEMILVQQWIGALLNVQAFGTSDGGLLAAGQAACNTDDIPTITNAAGGLDLFNGSGDNITSTLFTGSATPKAAKAFANIAFWDAV